MAAKAKKAKKRVGKKKAGKLYKRRRHTRSDPARPPHGKPARRDEDDDDFGPIVKGK